MRPILTLSLSAALLLSALSPMLAGAAAPVSVGPQYDTTHVYVAPNDVDAFVRSFTATFGGQSTRQVIATVTPTPAAPARNWYRRRQARCRCSGFVRRCRTHSVTNAPATWSPTCSKQ